MYASLDTFKDAIKRLGDLREEGLLRVMVARHGPVGFDLDSTATGVPDAGGGLYLDLYDAFGAIASKATVEEFIEARGIARSPKFPEPETQEIARAKYEAMTARFPPEQLLDWPLPQTPNLYVLTGGDWEVLP
jgi:hypothetical protein